MIEARAVRADELARNERGARLCTQRVVGGRVRVAEVFDDRVLFVDERYPAVEIGNDDRSLLFVEVTRQSESLHEVDVCAVEGKTLKPVIPPIGDDQQGRRSPCIDPDAVRLVELSGL